MEVRPRGRPIGSTPSTKIRKPRAGNSTDVPAADQDDSAAERRRTQVRIAQRAYRQKQESILQELRQQAADLTDTVKLMNKSFNDYRDRIVRSDLPDIQLQDVQETALAMESLMDVIRKPDQSVSEKRAARKGQRKHAKSAEREPLPEPKHVSDWLDPTALPQGQQSPQRVARPSGGWGYSLSTHRLSPTAEYVPGFTPSSTPTPSASMDPLPSDQQNAHAQRMALDQGSILQQPRPPRTYSFAETTFARRLHRATAEQAYKLLHEYDKRPTTYKRSFRLSLMSRDRETLIKMTREILALGPREPLDQETALIHVGGAGTHFPKRDAFGRLQPKPQTWHVGIVGPQKLALLEDAVKGNITVNMTVDIAGFEGEWFDPYDVEGYLAEKGIHIDPLASFAVAEVALPSVVPRYTSGPAFPPSEAGAHSINPVNLPFLHQLSLPSLFGEGDQIASAWSTGETMPEQHRQTKRIMIDVSKFIHFLMVFSVCLCRTPGFNRVDVDRALELASVDAY